MPLFPLRLIRGTFLLGATRDTKNDKSHKVISCHPEWWLQVDLVPN
jgi:hypothetical protein